MRRFRAQRKKLRVLGLGLSIQVLGFRVEDFWLIVVGEGLGVQGLLGFNCGVYGSARNEANEKNEGNLRVCENNCVYWSCDRLVERALV